MKRILILATLALLISGAAQAQSDGYICLFIDQARTSQCASSGSYPAIYYMYIWCLPSTLGSWCAEFMVDYPDDATVIAAGATWDPNLSIKMGELNTGVSVCYPTCQTDWFRPVYQMIICQTSTRNVIAIVDHPQSHDLLFSQCAEPRTVYSVLAWNNLYLNYVDGVDPECEYTSTEESTWGAIKRLYAE